MKARLSWLSLVSPSLLDTDTLSDNSSAQHIWANTGLGQQHGRIPSSSHLPRQLNTRRLRKRPLRVKAGYLLPTPPSFPGAMWVSAGRQSSYKQWCSSASRCHQLTQTPFHLGNYVLGELGRRNKSPTFKVLQSLYFEFRDVKCI